LFEKCQNAQQRAVSRHTLLIFPDVPPVRLQKIIFAWRKNPSPLVIPPTFKQGLITNKTMKLFYWDRICGPAAKPPVMLSILFLAPQARRRSAPQSKTF